MPTKAKLTKAEYDALDAEGKKAYEAIGDFFVFTGEIPDVTNLQTALDNERQLHQTAANQLKAYAGIDPAKAKEALAAQQKPTKEHDLNTIEGLRAALADTQKAINDMRTDFDTKIKTKEDAANQLITDRAIESVLVKAGVIPEAMPDAMAAVRKMVRPLAGDPAELGVLGANDTFIGTPFETWATNDLRKQKSWFFADSGNGGTGSRVNRNSPALGAVDVSKLSATERLKYANEQEAAASATAK